MISDLQQREVFHLVFLRQFVRLVKPDSYALKGGSNLRFFYNSIRYSEDMDIDIKGIEVHALRDIVMGIVSSNILATNLRPFNIERIIPPDIRRAKQTETVQRFKVHLITSSGIDLFTKIEFSRRRLESELKQEPVNAAILSAYRQPPLIVSHYLIGLAIEQKIRALADRAHVQARDVFDIFMLHSQINGEDIDAIRKTLSRQKLKSAEESLLSISYEMFRDTVCNYLSDGDREHYDRADVWDEVQLRVSGIISRL